MKKANQTAELMDIHEVSKLAGVSIRTLHYYDEIGLLVPKEINEAGYRKYDEANLETLHQILLFRELEFPLKDIKKIIGNPDFDKMKALNEQIELLELKREHLENLINHANRIKQKEEMKMSFEPFDKSKIEAYKELAKETWGKTEAYKEFEKKDAGYTEVEKRTHAEELMNIFFEFGDLKKLDPAAPEVQAKVKELQDFITAKYYKCTNQILKGLGQMYVSGGEMTTNIDVAGGKGCAEFVSKAIEIYCK